MTSNATDGTLSAYTTKLLAYKLSKLEHCRNTNAALYAQAKINGHTLPRELNYWLEDALHLFRTGNLTLEEACTLEHISPEVFDISKANFPLSCQREKRCLTPFSPYEETIGRILMGTCCIPYLIWMCFLVISTTGLVFPEKVSVLFDAAYANSFFVLSIFSCLLCIGATAILSIMTLCDERARIIPYELSYALGSLGFVYVFLTCGASGAVAALLFALLLLGFFKGASLFSEMLTHKAGIGAGDVRTIPFLAFFSIAGSGLFKRFITLKQSIIDEKPVEVAASNSPLASASSAPYSPFTVSGEHLYRLFSDATYLILLGLCVITIVTLVRALFEKKRQNGQWEGLSTRIPMGISITAGFATVMAAPFITMLWQMIA